MTLKIKNKCRVCGKYIPSHKDFCSKECVRLFRSKQGYRMACQSRYEKQMREIGYRREDLYEQNQVAKNL